MMANRSDRRLLTLRCVRALEAVGMSTRTRRADFHQGQGSFATPISQAGYMTATRFPLSVPHPCTRAGSIYDTTALSFLVPLPVREGLGRVLRQRRWTRPHAALAAPSCLRNKRDQRIIRDPPHQAATRFLASTC